MSIDNFLDTDPETTSMISVVFEELFRLCPVSPKPLLKVKAKEHISAYDPRTNTIYICVAPDSYLPLLKEILEEIAKPELWSALLSEIIGEYIHASQASIQGETLSPRVTNSGSVTTSPLGAKDMVKISSRLSFVLRGLQA